MGKTALDLFREEKAIFERDIASYIQGKMIVFKEKTGFTPSGINVHMVDATTMSDNETVFCVGSVESIFSIFR